MNTIIEYSRDGIISSLCGLQSSQQYIDTRKGRRRIVTSLLSTFTDSVIDGAYTIYIIICTNNIRKHLLDSRDIRAIFRESNNKHCVKMPKPTKGDRTKLVERLTRSHCNQTNENYAEFLNNNGGAKIKELFPEELANYSTKDLNNSRSTIKENEMKAAINSNNHSAAASENLQQPPQLVQQGSGFGR